jgi:hypothetical protein
MNAHLIRTLALHRAAPAAAPPVDPGVTLLASWRPQLAMISDPAGGSALIVGQRRARALHSRAGARQRHAGSILFGLAGFYLCADAWPKTCAAAPAA